MTHGSASTGTPDDAAPLTDPIGLALTAIGAGATAGALAITVGVAVLRALQGATVRTGSDSASFLVLTTSVMAGLVVAAATTLFVTRRIDDLWRRSVAAAIAVFCAFLLSGVSAPIDLTVGRPGLVGFAVVLLVTCVLLTRRALAIARR